MEDRARHHTHHLRSPVGEALLGGHRIRLGTAGRARGRVAGAVPSFPNRAQPAVSHSPLLGRRVWISWSRASSSSRSRWRPNRRSSSCPYWDWRSSRPEDRFDRPESSLLGAIRRSRCIPGLLCPVPSPGLALVGRFCSCCFACFGLSGISSTSINRLGLYGDWDDASVNGALQVVHRLGAGGP